MDKTNMRHNRRGLSATMTAVKPHTREEKEFIKGFANALNHATAVIAAEPELSVSAGSIADRVQTAYSRFQPERRTAIQQRARARLSGPVEQRQRYFGAYADRGAEAWTDAEPGLDRELKRLLHDAVYARLDFQSQDITEGLAVGVATEFSGGAVPLPKTTLEIGFFSGDTAVAWTSTTITAPISVDLRWQTNIADAQRGVWQLFQSGQSGQQEVLLGSGHAGKAPGSIFSIDLGNYLPPKPPNVPALYRVRVTPGTNPGMVQGSKSGQAWKNPGKAVGPPSNDVLITYSSVVQPGVEFQIFQIYREATFVLESIHMVEDQQGPGCEEFHVAGFVNESFPAGSTEAGSQDKFGPMYAELCPDGPRWKSFGHSASFSLNDPDTPEWPRAYTVLISVLEEDDGGDLNDWESGLWDIADEVLSGSTGEFIRDYLEEKFEDYVGENIGQILNAGGQMAQLILNLVASVAGGVIGMVVAAASLVIADIISGMDDDYYGAEVFLFVLPTNTQGFVESLPGHAIAGGYQLDTEYAWLTGYTSWPEAAAFDGIVEVLFHWEFTKLGQS